MSLLSSQEYFLCTKLIRELASITPIKKKLYLGGFYDLFTKKLLLLSSLKNKKRKLTFSSSEKNTNFYYFTDKEKPKVYSFITLSLPSPSKENYKKRKLEEK